jgi:hypothetical protein
MSHRSSRIQDQPAWILATLLLACAVRTEVRTIYGAPPAGLVVAKDSGARFGTIAAALDSAHDGDTVSVLPGVYREVVKVTKLRGITLLGQDPATTILDAGGEYAAVELRTGGNRVAGFTIRNADSHGIWVRDGHQFIDHCIVAGNGDRGIYLSAMAGFAYATIDHCTVTDNGEVGIHAARDDSNTVITNCIIAYNPRGIGTDHGLGRMKVRCNCLWNSETDFDRVVPKDSNILTDPRFLDRERGDFRLARKSPCLKAGTGGTNLGAF